MVGAQYRNATPEQKGRFISTAHELLKARNLNHALESFARLNDGIATMEKIISLIIMTHNYNQGFLTNDVGTTGAVYKFANVPSVILHNPSQYMYSDPVICQGDVRCLAIIRGAPLSFIACVKFPRKKEQTSEAGNLWLFNGDPS